MNGPNMFTNHTPHDPTQPISVVFARHGRTALNAAGKLRGRADPPLDEVGQLEADHLADMLAEMPIHAVVSSPRLRARQTAEAVAARHDLTVVVDAGLDDRDYGEWTGHVTDDVVARFGSVDAAPGVEIRADFENRVLATFHHLVGMASEGRLVIVAHDAINRVLLARLVDDLPDDPGLIQQDTGCWNRLELISGRWHAPVVNSRSRLDEAEPPVT